MKVPLLDLSCQNAPLADELTEVFRGVLDSSRFILGPEVEALEASIAEMSGAKHGIGVSSGTDALILALMALKIGPGDEVICPAFTFFATAGSVARVGAVPVFVDSCPVCFNIDVASTAAAITDRTKAILPVHLFGQAAEMDGILALAREHGVAVIEDGAQALGAGYRGKPVGAIGDFGTFSFFPSKNLGGFGDGGMVVTNNDDLADLAKVLRTHGSRPKYFHQHVGGNFRLDPLQAALLSVKLPHYEGYTAQRQSNAAYYTEQLSGLDGVCSADPSHCGCLEAQDEALEGTAIVLPMAYPHSDHIWNQYTLRVRGEGRRDALKEHLGSAGIGSEIYYPLTMDKQECFEKNSRTPAPPKTGHRLADEALSIPIYPGLTTEMQDTVVAEIANFLRF